MQLFKNIWRKIRPHFFPIHWSTILLSLVYMLTIAMLTFNFVYLHPY